MNSEIQQQELPPWESNQQPHSKEDSGNIDITDTNNGSTSRRRDDTKCGRLIKKCGPIGCYFSPMFDKLGYSLWATLYHVIMFPYTLAVMIFIITAWSLSVGFLVLICGFILYWLTCEIAVLFARVDLALAYYMVEDNKELIMRNGIGHNGKSIQLHLYKELGPCPCSKNSSLKFCHALYIRMKSISLNCDTVKILLLQSIFKPLIVFTTYWIAIVVVYTFASLFAPIVYLISPSVFTKHYWCPLGGSTDCEDGVCHCNGPSVENFGGALLFAFISFLLLPLILHINNLFAQWSKAVSYLFLTNYYHKDNNKDEQKGNLLKVGGSNNNSNNNNNNDNGGSNNGPVRDESISMDGQNPTKPGIVHSLNNPYMDPQV